MTGVVSRSKFVDAESNDVTLHVRVDADLANRGEERHIRGNIEIHCVIIIGWEEDEMRKDQHYKKNVLSLIYSSILLIRGGEVNFSVKSFFTNKAKWKKLIGNYCQNCFKPKSPESRLKFFLGETEGGGEGKKRGR